MGTYIFAFYAHPLIYRNPFHQNADLAELFTRETAFRKRGTTVNSPDIRGLDSGIVGVDGW